MDTNEFRAKLKQLSMKDLARFIIDLQTRAEATRSGATKRSDDLEELVVGCEDSDECLSLAIEVFCARTHKPQIKPENTHALEAKLWSYIPKRARRELELRVIEPEVLDTMNLNQED